MLGVPDPRPTLARLFIVSTRVAKALADWQVDELPGDYYRMQNVDGDDIGLLLKAFGLEIPAKIYTNGDIRGLKSAVNPF